jgi:hypothetical protein
MSVFLLSNRVDENIGPVVKLGILRGPQRGRRTVREFATYLRDRGREMRRCGVFHRCGWSDDGGGVAHVATAGSLRAQFAQIS